MKDNNLQSVLEPVSEEALTKKKAHFEKEKKEVYGEEA